MAGNLPAWLVLLVAVIGGGGVAAIGGVVTGYLKDRRTADTEERSVAIAEVDKAIPGLGEIIQQLRAQNASQAREIARLNDRNQEQAGHIFNLQRRVSDLERDLAYERGLR